MLVPLERPNRTYRFGKEETIAKFRSYDEKLRQIPLRKAFEDVITHLNKKDEVMQNKLMVLAEAVQKGEMTAQEAQRAGSDVAAYLKKYREIVAYLTKEKNNLMY